MMMSYLLFQFGPKLSHIIISRTDEMHFTLGEGMGEINFFLCIFDYILFLVFFLGFVVKTRIAFHSFNKAFILFQSRRSFFFA